MPGPLAGLRVVELATAIQGPAVGLYFANMGADVIKVEPPMGDPSRYHRGVNNNLPEDALCSQFLAMNKGKRSVSLDLHTNLGRDAMQRLLAGADVFCSNYRASALDRMGLRFEALLEQHPRLVIGHVNGFGPQGEDADKAMLDGAAQARGGLAGMTGPQGETPMPPGVAVADHAGAMQLALGCATALVTRAATGRGQLVQTSSLGAQLWLQMWELQHSAITGVSLSREGAHHPNIKAPYGVYTTADGVSIVFVVAMTDDAWTDFWVFMERPEALLMEEWDSTAKRVGMVPSEKGLREIRQLMTEAIGSKSFAELAAFFASQPEIIWERVRSHDEVLADPQNIANDYIVDIDLPVTGATKTVGALMAFSATPPPHLCAPPALGAHTAEVLAEVGFAKADVQAVQTHSESVREQTYADYLGES